LNLEELYQRNICWKER